LSENTSQTLVVLDFETSGMSPDQGDRAIEVGAVLLKDRQIVDSFQSLMNPGFPVNSFIQEFTGISNSMLQKAPVNTTVMADFAEFIADYPLVAHNASFDRRFLAAELQQIGCRRPLDFVCSMLVARRIYPEAPNHKLATLVGYKQLPIGGRFHRALADAEMTAQLWLRMLEDLRDAYGFRQVPFGLLQKLSKVTKKQVPQFLEKQRGELSRSL
jgi:DNA polymerase III subunit epsilon